MFSSFAIKSGLLDGRDSRRLMRELNRTAKRHRRKWHAYPDPNLMSRKERRMMAHQQEVTRG